MRRGGIIFLIIIVAAAGGAAAGYWYAGSTSQRPPSSATEGAATAAERNILYYRDPSGAPYWSAEPKKDAQGRDYLPVYDDQERSAAQQPKKPQAAAGERKILHYRNPMGLPDTSPVPKKDSMGMDYIPVHACDDQGDDNTVKVSLDRVQRSGVRTEPAESRVIVRPVR